MTFTEWLKKQCERDDMVGDLAKDMSYDSRWIDPESRERLLSYLRDRQASSPVLRAARMAWEQYEKAHPATEETLVHVVDRVACGWVDFSGMWDSLDADLTIADLLTLLDGLRYQQWDIIRERDKDSEGIAIDKDSGALSYQEVDVVVQAVYAEAERRDDEQGN